MSVQNSIVSLGQMIALRRGRRGGGYVVFTGAGASKSSGYPLGGQVRDRYLELLYPHEPPKSRPESFAKEHSAPPTYAAVSRTVLDHFGKDGARDWILSLFERGEPSSGYRHLAELVQEAYFTDSLFTANWDDALESVLPGSKAVIREEDMRHSRNTDFSIYKVHGDFQQPDTMVWDQDRLQGWSAEKFRSAVREYAPIFVGYSGSDRDIIEALRPALKKSGGPREAWFVGPWDDGVPTEVVAFLDAFGKPKNALSIGFDDFMRQLSDAIYDRAAPLKEEDRQKAPALTRSLHSRVYRIVRSHAPPIPESPLPFQGRWHSPGERTLYAALSHDSALVELFAHGRPIDFEASPFDLVELEVQLHKVLDLLDPSNLVAMQIDQRIIGNQHRGREVVERVRDAGVEALIAPSRWSPNGRVLVVFLDALLSNSRVTVLNRHRITNGG